MYERYIFIWGTGRTSINNNSSCLLHVKYAKSHRESLFPKSLHFLKKRTAEQQQEMASTNCAAGVPRVIWTGVILWRCYSIFFDFLLITSKTGGWTRSTHQITADSTICSTTIEISLSVPGESIRPTLERHRTAALPRSQQGLSQSPTCCYFSTSMLFILVLLTCSIIAFI